MECLDVFWSNVFSMFKKNIKFVCCNHVM